MFAILGVVNGVYYQQEMMLLHEVDKPASDVDEYVQNLESIL